MATVRISGNWRNINKIELAGNTALDKEGRLERSLDMPEECYQAVETALTKGENEGTVYLPNGSRVDYFVDR
jgi:hypothetical protein